MKVTITYFKPSGKYYTEDENVDWLEDPDHYTGWQPFETIVRLRDMFAVCMETPLGYPQFSYPQTHESLEYLAENVNAQNARLQLDDLRTPRTTCLSCRGTRAVAVEGSLAMRACLTCGGRGTIHSQRRE